MDNKRAISLLEINPSEDGLGFTVEVPEEFETWFMQSRGLTEWSDQIFNTWFKGLISEAISDRDSLSNVIRSDQQSVDVWTTGVEEDERQ